MERTIEQQAEEIAELGREMERLRGVIKSIAEAAKLACEAGEK